MWALGFVSLFMDLSTEMIQALLPVYLVTMLGASAFAVGFIEGIGEATNAVTRIFSGALSDWLGRRKLLAATGYALATLAKPMFPLATTLNLIVAARFIDRLGKGIRGAPRDALLADIVPADLRGASFGLRQSLDTAGAFLGPLAAIVLMWLTADRFRSVFWIAVLPALVSVGLILIVVHEPERPKQRRPARMPLSRSELGQFGPAYWWLIAVASLFTLARFSEAFLVLRARSIDLPLALIPGVLVVMNIAYMASAYPAGALSDRLDRVTVLIIGLVFLLAADILLAFAPGTAVLVAGTLLWGLHMGFTQGLFAALVADVSPPELRGTGFGMFNLITGLVVLLASVIAGALWDAFGPRGTFLAGGVFVLLAFVGLWPLKRRSAAAQP